MYEEWSAQDLKDRLDRGEKLNLVDVREPEEWREGHIAEARHIPLSQFTERVGESHAEDEDAPLVFICRSGNRSGRVCDYLSQQGYTVVNMAGGMLAWPGDVRTGD